MSSAFSVVPADAGRWSDIETVLGPSGGAVGCWCTFWRLTNQDARDRTADDNRATLESLVRSPGPDTPGLVAYEGDEAVGWCSVAPRTQFCRVPRTTGLAPLDPAEADVWSIVCVFVPQGQRGRGVATTLAAAAVEHARAHGAAAIEAYPVADPAAGRASGLSSGTISLFEGAGLQLDGRSAVGRRVVMRTQLR
jgi:GNAT superfamily N-acetyltransferase